MSRVPTGSAAYAFSTVARYHCLSTELCARHLSPPRRGVCGRGPRGEERVESGG